MGKFDRNFIIDLQNEIMREVYEDSSDMLYKFKQYLDNKEVIAMPKETFIELFADNEKKIKESIVFSIKNHIRDFLKEEYKRGYNIAKDKYKKKS